MFREKNIFVLASKSGKLTSHYFEIWLREVYFPNVGPKLVLLLDSWPEYCPDVIAINKPESAEDSVFLIILCIQHFFITTIICVISLTLKYYIIY